MLNREENYKKLLSWESAAEEITSEDYIELS